MTFDRVAIVESSLDTYLAGAAASPARLPDDAPLRKGSGLTARKAVEIFEDQVTSRQLDVAARELKKTNRSFYTISSAGHENNAVIGAQLRIDDPAFLHYRSGALMMARARQLPGSTPAFDSLLGIVASSALSIGLFTIWSTRFVTTSASAPPKRAPTSPPETRTELSKRVTKDRGLFRASANP